MLGVPGASTCLLEATIPYSFKAFDEKMAAGPPAPGYCSREVKCSLGMISCMSMILACSMAAWALEAFETKEYAFV